MRPLVPSFRGRPVTFVAALILMAAGAASLGVAFLFVYGPEVWRDALFKVGMGAGLLLGAFGIAMMLVGGWLESRAIDRPR